MGLVEGPSVKGRVRRHFESERKESVRYKDALYDGHASLQKRPLTTVTTVQVVRTLGERGSRPAKWPGTALLITGTGESMLPPMKFFEEESTKNLFC